MICPNCGFDNLPGNEACSNCQQDLTPLDRPHAASQVERSLMEDPVAVLGYRTPITIEEQSSVRAAMATMLSANVGALLVVDEDKKLVGIFSERDLLRKIAGLEENFADLPVQQFMTAK